MLTHCFQSAKKIIGVVVVVLLPVFASNDKKRACRGQGSNGASLRPFCT